MVCNIYARLAHVWKQPRSRAPAQGHQQSITVTNMSTQKVHGVFEYMTKLDNCLEYTVALIQNENNCHMLKALPESYRNCYKLTWNLKFLCYILINVNNRSAEGCFITTMRVTKSCVPKTSIQAFYCDWWMPALYLKTLSSVGCYIDCAIGLSRIANWN